MKSLNFKKNSLEILQENFKKIMMSNTHIIQLFVWATDNSCEVCSPTYWGDLDTYISEISENEIPDLYDKYKEEGLSMEEMTKRLYKSTCDHFCANML